MPNAQYPMPNAQCPVPSAQGPVPSAQCPTPSAQCPVPNAQCPVPSADDRRTPVVWDAFAGSGAFGIEFLSRNWAKYAIFTDTNAGAVRTIRKNLTGIDGDAIVKTTDALSAADEFGPRADVIFLDPPYADHELGEKLVKKLSRIAKAGAIVVWEQEQGTGTGKRNGNFTILKDKTYGRARFLIMKKE